MVRRAMKGLLEAKDEGFPGGLPLLLLLLLLVHGKPHLIQKKRVIKSQLFQILITITRTKVTGAHVNLQTDRARLWSLVVPKGCSELGRFPVLDSRIMQPS